MNSTSSNNAVDVGTLRDFLAHHASDEELTELAKIVKCPKHTGKRTFARAIVKRLYKCYQTPMGYMIKTPTLDDMCDRTAKKLKLRTLQGTGWQRLHSLSIKVFEHLFQSMTDREKEQLLTAMWGHLTDEDKTQLKHNFNVVDVASFVHHSEMMVAHVVALHLARETALYTAAAVLRINLGAELALTASTVLTRTATLFLGPLGWALVAVSINDLMGTNFKRIVPALLTINIVNMRVHNPRGAQFQMPRPDADLCAANS